MNSSGSIAMAGSSITSAPSSSSRTRSSLACSRARVTTTERPNNGRASNQARSSAATSPTTIALGGSTPASAMVARVARTVRWSGRVPLRTAATGVSARAPTVDQAPGDVADAARAHEDHERPAGPGQRLPVDVGAVLGRVLVAGDDGEVGRDAAVGHRDARVGGGADGAGDPGDHLEGDAGGGQRLRLLAAAAEHERVTALQPHDAAGGPAPVDQHLVDLLLGEVDLARRLARGDQLGVRRARGRAAPATPGGRRRRRRPGASSSAPRTVRSPGSPGPAPTR